MQQRIDELMASVNVPDGSSLTFYHELDPTYFSVTSSTFIGQVYAMLGLTNIADEAEGAGSGYPQLSEEYILSQNPDLIFLADTKCCDQDKETVIQRAFEAFKDRYDVDQTDGIRLSFEQGWGLIRASNTQPVLVMRFEASTSELLKEYRHEVETWLTKHAPEVNLNDAGHHA